MVGIIKIINGQKKIVPLTADAGAGNPVGTVIVVCSNQIPSNYLPLGTQFDTSLYPVLYALLGTDTTPTASALGLPTLTSGQYAIKATSGLSENAQDNVINTLNEQRSYSTEEHLTGRKWIDGKPIYEKTYTLSIASVEQDFNHLISNLDKIVKMGGMIYTTNGTMLPFGFTAVNGTFFFSGYCDSTKIYTRTVSAYTSTTANITLEYTKTTD